MFVSNMSFQMPEGPPVDEVCGSVTALLAGCHLVCFLSCTCIFLDTRSISYDLSNWKTNCGILHCSLMLI